MQGRVCLLVARHVCRELRVPEVDSGGGHRRQLATSMSMPEAAMNEDDASILREDEVRSARERSIIGLEPQTCSMQIAADQQFGLRVTSSDPPHHQRSLFRADDVDHGCTGVPPGPSTDVRSLDPLDGFIHADSRQVCQVDRISQRNHARWRIERLREPREALVNRIDAAVPQLEAHQLP